MHLHTSYIKKTKHQAIKTQSAHVKESKDKFTDHVVEKLENLNQDLIIQEPCQIYYRNASIY